MTARLFFEAKCNCSFDDCWPEAANGSQGGKPYENRLQRITGDRSLWHLGCNRVESTPHERAVQER
jgi:hypothetical protein